MSNFIPPVNCQQTAQVTQQYNQGFIGSQDFVGNVYDNTIQARSNGSNYYGVATNDFDNNHDASQQDDTNYHDGSQHYSSNINESGSHYDVSQSSNVNINENTTGTGNESVSRTDASQSSNVNTNDKSTGNDGAGDVEASQISKDNSAKDTAKDTAGYVDASTLISSPNAGSEQPDLLDDKNFPWDSLVNFNPTPFPDLDEP